MSDRTPNNDEVICPNCVHQFRAIPVNVQEQLARVIEERDSAYRKGLEAAAKVCMESKAQWAGMVGDFAHSEEGCYECGREDQCVVLASRILELVKP